MLYSVRSERMLVEQIRWFIGLGMDEAVWHATTFTDPDARLRRKGGDGAKPVYSGNLVTENRHGLVVAASVTKSEGSFGTVAALDLLGRKKRAGGTVGADKGYDQAAFTDGLRKRGLTPHVAQNDSGHRSSAIDGRTTRHSGYAISQRRRKMVEEVFGWMKTVGFMRKLRHRGTRLVDWMFRVRCRGLQPRMNAKLMPTGAVEAAV